MSQDWRLTSYGHQSRKRSEPECRRLLKGKGKRAGRVPDGTETRTPGPQNWNERNENYTVDLIKRGIIRGSARNFVRSLRASNDGSDPREQASRSDFSPPPLASFLVLTAVRSESLPVRYVPRERLFFPPLIRTGRATTPIHSPARAALSRPRLSLPPYSITQTRKLSNARRAGPFPSSLLLCAVHARWKL